MVYTRGRESRGSGFETHSSVITRAALLTCGHARMMTSGPWLINKSAGESQVHSLLQPRDHRNCHHSDCHGLSDRCHRDAHARVRRRIDGDAAAAFKEPPASPRRCSSRCARRRAQRVPHAARHRLAAPAAGVVAAGSSQTHRLRASGPHRRLPVSVSGPHRRLPVSVSGLGPLAEPRRCR
jgi:hypothetical protein